MCLTYERYDSPVGNFGLTQIQNLQVGQMIRYD